MQTVYKLVPEEASNEGGRKKRVDLDLGRFQEALPESMRVKQQDDGVYLEVDSESEEDEETQHLVDRELDRVFFLTFVRLRAEMCKRSVGASFESGYFVHGTLPEGLGPQAWNDELSTQMKLWSLAVFSRDIAMKVLLYFQIIELSYPELNCKAAYPIYTDENRSPEKRTEAKLLRHLVAHASKPLPQAETYLRHLGLPPMLSNLRHPQWDEAIKGRLHVVENEAREILRRKLDL